MYIDQIIYPIESLGPGKRLCIWTVGCRRGCPGCSNPELWSTEGRRNVPVSQLLATIRDICLQNTVNGFTISGGEPMNQPEELLDLVRGLTVYSRDILVFSGYTYEELSETRPEILNEIAVLVDGPYIESQNRQLPLRGSANQRVLLFEPILEERYLQYLNSPHSPIQNLHFADGTISVGIHRRHFQEDLEEQLEKYGLRRDHNGTDEMA